ncbi:MAG: MBOAT family protein [Ruminococcaceae bacterium]|nr:MBOAT family protein [Oscillospiraceae bacterium]
MLFSSISFLYFFLPAVLILYFIVPKALKNTVLLLSGLVFYAWGEPRYCIIMVFSILVGYVFGLLIEKFRGKKLSKLFMILSVMVDLGLLVYFKYVDFFISNFNNVTGLSVPLLRIALPIGISFYTFQILSYTVDVYRGDVPAQKNPITLGAYISMFPQLIAGPIVRYSNVEKELRTRTHTLEKTFDGIIRFCVGFGKKILIANALGELCETFKATDEKTVLFYWLYAVAFSLHIYFDFSGYSDMAIGLGKIFGFTFMENFNYPYISKSVTEFWRRWHMSLGQWFRDYVYIPLGGNRVSLMKHLRNIFVVWFLTGFWHGADWNFIVWGLYFAVLLTLEKMWLGKYLARSKVLSRIYVLFLVVISFVIFNAAGMGEAMQYIGGMFGIGVEGFAGDMWLYNLRSYAFILVAAAIGATPVPKLLVKKLKETKAGSTAVAVLSPVFAAVIIILCTAFLVDGSFNPFLYFRF